MRTRTRARAAQGLIRAAHAHTRTAVARSRATLAPALSCGAAIGALALAGAAQAATVTVLDPSGSGVSAYGGWSAWTHSGPGVNEYELMVRSPQGAVSAAAVPPSNGVFAVQLGPGPSGGAAAVYQRCSDPAHTRGCHLFLVQLGQPASEQQLAIPGGGSDFSPAIWKRRLAFLRPNAAGGSRRPDNLYTWSIGAAGVQAVVLPASRGGREPGGGHWPKGLTGQITGLTIGPAQLAYVTSNQVGSFGESTLWYEPLGGRPQLIDQETGGAGNVCPPSFLSPLLAGPWLYAYLHACDPSANPGLDRLTRYKHGTGERAKFTFVHAGDDGIDSVVLDGSGADWADEGSVKHLASLSWRRIALPVAQTFCSRADPFC
jgi:hypothetical protein